MFTVRPETVMGLFHAQRRDLQGVLRLDISSRTFPADPGIPCGCGEAQQAVAERLLRLLAGYADEQVLKWDADHLPEKFTVITNQEQFNPNLIAGLNRVYGLDPEQPAYPRALQALARELFDWAAASGEEAWEQHRLGTYGRDVYIEARPYPPLGRNEQNTKASRDWDSSELRRRLYTR